MTSTLRAALLAAIATFAIGGAAAHAGDLDDLLGTYESAAALDAVAGNDDLIAQAVEAAASEAAVDTLLDAVAEAADQ